MNKDELCAQASAGVSGWVSLDGGGARTSRATSVHEELLALVRHSGSTRGQAEALKVGLIKRINAESRALALDALHLATKLQDSQFGMEVEDSSGGVSWATFKASRVPPANEAPVVMRLATTLHAQRVQRQDCAMRAFKLEAQLLEAEADRATAQMEDLAIKVRQISSEIARHKDRIKEELAKLSASTRSLILSDTYYVSSGTWSHWALPIELPISASESALIEASDWFERLRHAMYQPLPLDEKAPTSLVHRWKRQWAAYEDCGSAFGVLAVWLRSLANSGGSQRCQICYRHLGPNLRRFCSEHKRTAFQRQKTRDLNVSGLYRPLAERLVRSRPLVLKQMSTWSLPEEEVRAMSEQARQFGLDSKLVIPAATLAAELRRLYPVLTPSVRDLLQLRFEQLAFIAQAPFEREKARRADDWESMGYQKHEAAIWMDRRTLFKAVFGPKAPVRWCRDKTLGDDLDRDHPMVSAAGVGPQRLALDLLHLGAWREIDKRFNRQAYLDRDNLYQLRRGSATTGQRGMSLAEIGAAVGASPEAVRQTLRLASGESACSKRRRRVISAGVRSLAQQLAQEL